MSDVDSAPGREPRSLAASYLLNILRLQCYIAGSTVTVRRQ